MSIKEDIFKANDTKLKQMEIPEWGTVVYLRSWSTSERFRWSEAAKLADQSAVASSRALALAAVFSLADASGVRVFADNDCEALTHKSGEVLQRILDESLKHNGLNGSDEVKND